MSWLTHLKIVQKVGLIVAILAIVTLAVTAFSITKTNSLAADFSDMVEKTDVGSLTLVRANRSLDSYKLAIVELANATTAEENAVHLKSTEQARDQNKRRMESAVQLLPKRASDLAALSERVNRAFSICGPIAQYAATTVTAEDSAKALTRVRNECMPPLNDTIAVGVKLTDDLVTASAQQAARLKEDTETNRMMIMSGAALGLLAGVVMAMVIAISGLSKPIAALKAVMTSFASDDLKHEVPGLARRDELGDMARTVEVFKNNGLAMQQMRAEQAMDEQERAARRKADMMKLAGDFESAVGNIIQTVSSSAVQLEASARTLTSNAETTQKLSIIVASAAEESSANVQSVASASEEMSSSVNEISRQVQESARIAAEAVEQAQSTNVRVNELSESAKKIGDVVKLISTIADQTNLLALNATIESARAGEAGRGFAVVASEVKALAQQTAQATGDITRQIESIQSATDESVVAIRDIGQTIGRIAEISSAIAAAVEEQGAATQEISRNVQQAAQGTTQVASNITDVQRGSNETGSASAEVLSAAMSLSQESGRLNKEVQGFLATVRAA